MKNKHWWTIGATAATILLLAAGGSSLPTTILGLFGTIVNRGMTNDIVFARRADNGNGTHPGTGSWDDPFDATSDLSVPWNAKVKIRTAPHVMFKPGTYPIKHFIEAVDGMVVDGPGATLKADNAYWGNDDVNPELSHEQSLFGESNFLGTDHHVNVTVQNLTFDLNNHNQTLGGARIPAIWLRGSSAGANNKILNCHFINWGNEDTGAGEGELFLIRVGYDSIVEGNLIDTQGTVNHGSTTLIGPATNSNAQDDPVYRVKIRRNTINSVGDSHDAGAMNCINLGPCRYCDISYNFINDVNRGSGIYSDTGTHYYNTITYNTITNVHRTGGTLGYGTGILFSLAHGPGPDWTLQGDLIKGNNVSCGPLGIGINVSGANTLTSLGIVIEDNIISQHVGTSGAAFGLGVDTLTNGRLRGNYVFDTYAGTAISLNTCNGTEVSDNHANDYTYTTCTNLRKMLNMNLSGAYVDGLVLQADIGAETALTFDRSLVRISGTTIRLFGDQTSPGASKLYGTDAGGNKGWYSQPSGTFDVSANYTITGGWTFSGNQTFNGNVTSGASSTVDLSASTVNLGTVVNDLTVIPSDTGGWTEASVAGSDFTTSGTGANAITGLTQTLVANKEYEIQGRLLATTTGTNGCQFGFTTGGGLTFTYANMIFIGPSNVSSNLQSIITSGVNAKDVFTSSISKFLTTDLEDGTIFFHGWILVSGTGGTITIEAQHPTGGNTTFKIGSVLGMKKKL